MFDGIALDGEDFLSISSDFSCKVSEISDISVEECSAMPFNRSDFSASTVSLAVSSFSVGEVSAMVSEDVSFMATVSFILFLKDTL